MQQILPDLRQRLYTHYPKGEADALIWFLLEKRFNLSRTDIYMGKDKTFSENQRADLENIVTRLLRFEPIQYILGQTEFGTLTFRVEEGVLIPRPETLELVNWITADAPQKPLNIVDAGTGTGCIAISLAHLLPQAKLTAWDISPTALRLTAENAQHNHVDLSIETQDILSPNLPLEKQWDVIVSNPPYVMETERKEMDENVLHYEPELALFVPDEDPLKFYRALAHYGKKTLRQGGAIYFEINQALGQEMIDLMREVGYHSIELRQDDFKKNRMLKAIR